MSLRWFSKTSIIGRERKWRRCSGIAENWFTFDLEVWKAIECFGRLKEDKRRKWGIASTAHQGNGIKNERSNRGPIKR